MKNKTPLLLLAFLTAAAAMILANLNVELTASVVSSIGLAAMLFSEWRPGRWEDTTEAVSSTLRFARIIAAAAVRNARRRRGVLCFSW